MLKWNDAELIIRKLRLETTWIMSQYSVYSFIVLLVAICFGLNISPLTADENPVDFNREIRPILSDTCFKCHGPDEAERQADLRLDTEQGIRSAESIISPGDVDESEFLERIMSHDDADIMPPRDSGRVLTEQQKELLRTWIKQGAKWEKHWAFLSAKKPQPPTVTGNWVANEIDAFVLAKLTENKLAPNAVADRNTLIRRISLDLTGLPPDPKLVEEFVSSGSAKWYEQLVDRLLTSPHYGEHMARYWLDAARYADTHGLHLDNYREMWLYRDWVIESFNNNQPFSDFVVEQLAGDLLEEPSESQLIATGFNRAHVTTNEGGSITEEVLVRNVVDRVSTTGTVFMGLTVACAQCHDHKYDPITQQDFYSLYAFFNSLDANPMDGNAKEHAPSFRYFDDKQKQELAKLNGEREELIAKINTQVSEFQYVDSHDSAGGFDKPIEANTPSDAFWFDDELPPGVSNRGGWDTVDAGTLRPKSGRSSFVIRNDGFKQLVFENANSGLRFEPSDKLFAYVYLDPQNPPRQIMLQFNDGSWEHRAYWGENLISFGKDKTTSRLRLGDLPPTGKWVRLEVLAKDIGFKKRSTVRGFAFSQHGGQANWDSAGAATALVQRYQGDSLIDWQKYLGETEAIDLPKNLKQRFLKDEKARNAEASKSARNTEPMKDEDEAERAENVTEVSAEKKKLNADLKDYFLRNVNPESRSLIEEQVKRRDDLKRQVDDMTKKAPATLVWREKKEPVAAHILNRGEYDQKGDKVSRDTPSALPAFPEDLPRNRLGLANWLISGENPLTARVAVNRIWQQFFGTGIVATSEDFGAQGEHPSHPQLLDWLATDFVESEWNIKRLVKQIVMSAAYRQKTTASADKILRDPENRLLSRGPRFRLDAETLRDQALAVSGLLVDTVGGSSVKPPQPDGLWFAVGYSRSNTVRFKQDNGPDKVHRRSLYTFWKRTSPPPQMSTFDAPSRESCVMRRERTNTPLQALLLMNDPQYVEAARHLAQLTLDQKFKSVDEDIRFLHQRVMGRPLTDDNLKILKDNFEGNKFEFMRDPGSAAKLLQVGELPVGPGYDEVRLASLTMVANLLMNQDEFISKN